MEEFVIALTQQFGARADLEARACFKLINGARVSETLGEQLESAQIKWSMARPASRELFRAVQWADVVHAHAPSPDICAIARLLGKKLVLTIHNHLYGQRAMRKVVWRTALHLAHRRWYNSKFVRGSWERTPQTTRSEAFPAAARVDRQFAPLDGRNGFVFVSRMVPGKGAETLLKAYRSAHLDPVRWPLRLLGEGPLFTRLRNQFGGLAGVRFEGFVTQQRKEELIAQSRWLVACPNYLEAMGVTPLEARRRGVPCIVSRDGGLPEVAGSEALSCAPGDPLGLAQCLLEAAQMSEKDYRIRASATYESVARVLRPLDWYARSYYSVLGRTGHALAASRAN
jgi:glycosyltransferase involved in cell wall biosynthesis